MQLPGQLVPSSSVSVFHLSERRFLPKEDRLLKAKGREVKNTLGIYLFLMISLLPLHSSVIWHTPDMYIMEYANYACLM